MTDKELQASVELLAHKLKNPLHAALLNLEVLQVKLTKSGADEKLTQHLKIAATEVKRISEITNKYFEYLKLSEKKRQSTTLRKWLE